MLRSLRKVNRVASAGLQFWDPASMEKVALPLVAANSSAIETKRYYSATKRQESALIVGGLTCLAVGIVAQHAYGFYTEYQAKKAANPSQPSIDNPEDASKRNASEGEAATAQQQQQQTTRERTQSTNPADSPSFTFGSSWFARNFYEGGFEDKMTKREAALILGVRESASPERIKDAHRKILLINHPDRGGSAFIAAKINEAKDLLLKGK